MHYQHSLLPISEGQNEVHFSSTVNVFLLLINEGNVLVLSNLTAVADLHIH